MLAIFNLFLTEKWVTWVYIILVNFDEEIHLSGFIFFHLNYELWLFEQQHQNIIVINCHDILMFTGFTVLGSENHWGSFMWSTHYSAIFSKKIYPRSYLETRLYSSPSEKRKHRAQSPFWGIWGCLGGYFEIKINKWIMDSSGENCWSTAR